jgi:hypothetical protein
MHTLYVAAHRTAVALGGHIADLQGRLETGERRRQPLAERPTALEITAAQDMIARFDGFEQLAGAYLFVHLSMVASIDIAYVARDTAANHPGLTAPARIIGMRAQREAEIAIEQGETRYEGVTWTTRSQIAANQLIPLPEPARRGLINLADDVIATTNHAVAAAAQLRPSDVKGANRSGHEAHSGRFAETLQIARPHDPAPRGPRR